LIQIAPGNQVPVASWLIGSPEATGHQGEQLSPGSGDFSGWRPRPRSAVSRSLPHGVTSVDFLLPGIFVQSVTFGASQTAVGLSEDLTRGVVDRFRSMPMARSAGPAGRTAADLVRTSSSCG
jgi:hypothetical protein